MELQPNTQVKKSETVNRRRNRFKWREKNDMTRQMKRKTQNKKIYKIISVLN